MVKENKFQMDLKKELKLRFPGCIVQKLDPNDMQGIPDLLVLYGPYWATLEVKRSAHAPHRPNQDYYVNLMDQMSFSRFIHPDNKEEVLDELSHAFRSNGKTRISKR